VRVNDKKKNRDPGPNGSPQSTDGRARSDEERCEGEAKSKSGMDSRDGISKLMLAEKEAQAIVSAAREGTKVETRIG